MYVAYMSAPEHILFVMHPVACCLLADRTWQSRWPVRSDMACWLVLVVL